MTERKPVHESVPDFVERQILEAHERGDFDDLEGRGRPLEGIGRPDDELWWVRRKLREEHLVGLPPALQARRARDEALADAAQAPDEAAVRRIVTRANGVIRHVNRTTVSGPPTATMPLDVEQVVADWRTRRPAPPPAESTPPEPRPRWSLRARWSARRRAP